MQANRGPEGDHWASPPAAALRRPPVPTLGSAWSTLGLEPKCRSRLCSHQLFDLANRVTSPDMSCSPVTEETDFSFFWGAGLLGWNRHRPCHSYLPLVVFLVWVTHPHPQPTLAIVLVEWVNWLTADNFFSSSFLLPDLWLSRQQVKWEQGDHCLSPGSERRCSGSSPGIESDVAGQHVIDRNKLSLIKKQTSFSKPNRHSNSVILCNKHIDPKQKETCDYSVTGPGALVPNQPHLSQDMKPGRKRQHRPWFC